MLAGIDDDGGRIMRLQISLGAFKKRRRPTLSMGFLAAARRHRYFQTTADCRMQLFHRTDTNTFPSGCLLFWT